MQSTENKIYLLPALPDAWVTGSEQGIYANGGFELSMNWKNKSLTKVNIFAKSNGKTLLIYGNKYKEIELEKGLSIGVNW